MELANASDCVACFKLDVPVSTGDKLLDGSFENFVGIVLNWLQFIRRQVVLIVRGLGHS